MTQEEIRAKAGMKLNHAIQKGLVTKPECCERCGLKTFSKQLHGHHRNYAKPLEVDWLCYGCHSEVHRMMRWFDKRFRWLEYCHHEKMDPKEYVLPTVNLRTGKPNKETLFERWERTIYFYKR